MVILTQPFQVGKREEVEGRGRREKKERQGKGNGRERRGDRRGTCKNEPVLFSVSTFRFNDDQVAYSTGLLIHAKFSYPSVQCVAPVGDRPQNHPSRVM